MSTDDASDAIGVLNLSDSTKSNPSTKTTEIKRPATPPPDIGYDSDTDSSDSTETIRPSATTPTIHTMSKSKSADQLRSLSISDDIFDTSADEPTTSTALTRQGDRSIDNQTNIITSPQYAPRADRGTEINEYNAQGQLPPEAAIFCANLSNSRTPEQLAESVHTAFDTFGKCYVNVKYDKHHNPYAVIQYETSEAARSALRSGNRTMLDGRQIRLEQSKGDRAVLITLNNGGLVSEHEARDLLSQFGEIECIMSTDMIPDRAANEPRGQYVRFAYFLDCRDALRCLHEISEEYRIQLAAGLEPKRRIGPAGSEIYTSLGPARNNTDSKSIYVGNLPEACTDNEVHMAFSRFGTVENINLVRKTYPGGALNCFAFVEFASPLDSETASQSEIWIKGHKLRIEPKEYTARRNQRMAFESPPSSSVRSPPSSGYLQRRMIDTSPPTRRLPFRISPEASRALQERLASNDFHNNTVPAANPYGPSTPPLMVSPPRYNPYLTGRGSPYPTYTSSADAYQPRYESPSHGSALNWRQVGMIGGGLHSQVQELPQEAYGEPAFMSAQYAPPPELPRDWRRQNNTEQ